MTSKVPHSKYQEAVGFLVITFIGGTRLTSTGLVKSEAGGSPGALPGTNNAGSVSGNEAEMEEG